MDDYAGYVHMANGRMEMEIMNWPNYAQNNYSLDWSTPTSRRRFSVALVTAESVVKEEYVMLRLR